MKVGIDFNGTYTIDVTADNNEEAVAKAIAVFENMVRGFDAHKILYLLSREQMNISFEKAGVLK